jgi:hypothetical protein
MKTITINEETFSLQDQHWLNEAIVDWIVEQTGDDPCSFGFEIVVDYDTEDDNHPQLELLV